MGKSKEIVTMPTTDTLYKTHEIIRDFLPEIQEIFHVTARAISHYYTQFTILEKYYYSMSVQGCSRFEERKSKTKKS